MGGGLPQRYRYDKSMNADRVMERLQQQTERPMEERKEKRLRPEGSPTLERRAVLAQGRGRANIFYIVPIFCMSLRTEHLTLKPSRPADIQASCAPTAGFDASAGAFRFTIAITSKVKFRIRKLITTAK